MKFADANGSIINPGQTLINTAFNSITAKVKGQQGVAIEIVFADEKGKKVVVPLKEYFTGHIVSSENDSIFKLNGWRIR